MMFSTLIETKVHTLPWKAPSQLQLRPQSIDCYRQRLKQQLFSLVNETRSLALLYARRFMARGSCSHLLAGSFLAEANNCVNDTRHQDNTGAKYDGHGLTQQQ